MKLPLSILALAIISTDAFAQTTVVRTLDEQLTQDQGMAQIRQGLYARSDGMTDSYIALGAAGNQALLQELIQIRGTINDATETGNSQFNFINQAIYKLSNPQPDNPKDAQPVPKSGQVNQENGYCTGGPNPNGPLHVNAGAGGPNISQYGASGSSGNQDTSSMPIYTTNYVYTDVAQRGRDDSIKSDTQHGTTFAVVSNFPGAGCAAYAMATITCPGYTSPALTVMAMNNAGCP